MTQTQVFRDQPQPLPAVPMTTTLSADLSTNVRAVVDFFEGLQPSQAEDLTHLYAADARFKDPFNDVRGRAAIQRIFAHMFVALENPRFIVTQTVLQGQHCFLTWEFRFGFKRFKVGQEQVILGATHLIFATDGLIALHRDYWDAAEELYEKLPLVGSVMQWLKKRANS